MFLISKLQKLFCYVVSPKCPLFRLNKSPSFLVYFGMTESNFLFDDFDQIVI